MITTTADPTRPRKNMASMSRITKVAKTILSILPQLNVLNSALYASIAIIMEVVGRSCAFCRAAGAAVPDRGAHAAVAIGVRMVRAGSTALGAAGECGKREPASSPPHLRESVRGGPGSSPRILHRILLR